MMGRSMMGANKGDRYWQRTELGTIRSIEPLEYLMHFGFFRSSDSMNYTLTSSKNGYATSKMGTLHLFFQRYRTPIFSAIVPLSNLASIGLPNPLSTLYLVNVLGFRINQKRFSRRFALPG
jgi:hypothetical protein